MQVLQPPGWAKPRGYSNGISCKGTLVLVAGQIGWTADGRFETDAFAGQFAQALRNVVAVCQEAGAKPEHIVRLAWFITSKRDYLASIAEIGGAYRDIMGRHYPTMTVVEVSALIEDRAKIEIEATAVVPE